MIRFRPFVAVLGVLAASSALVACGSGGKGDSAPIVRVPVAIGEVRVIAAGANGAPSQLQKDAVTTTLSRYVTAATAAPLQRGTLGADLGDAFENAALATATGPDRVALLDDGLPGGSVTIEPVSADLDALIDSSGQVAVMTATMTVNARSKTDRGELRVSRLGTYVLHPDGNGWRIHAYDITVTRDLPEGITTTTGATR